MEFEAADYGEEGTGHFFEFITDDDLHDAFLKGNYPMMVARYEGSIVGVASLRPEGIAQKRHWHRAGGQTLQVPEGYMP